jgi:PleD family two-component response regulator
MKDQRSNLDEVYDDEVFQVLLDYEVTRSKRYPANISLIHIEYTPAGSEKALRSAFQIFSKTLNSHMRSADIPSAKKNEFKVLMPATGENGLISICERLISVFKNSFTTNDGSSIAFSINIGGVFHPGGDTLSRESFLESAQTALKQSKQKGPNTYVVLS